MVHLFCVFFFWSIPILICAHHVKKRMVMATEAEPHSRPYQTHNIMVLENGYVQICSGALISNKYVLTAAHCFKNFDEISKTIVVLGAHNLTSNDKVHQISKNYIIHNGFKQNSLGYTENDIALIKLKKPVKFTKNLQPIKLPNRSQISESFAGETASVAGWGKTESRDYSHILLEGHVKIEDDEEICKHPNPLICTWSSGIHAPCVGDSGGPLVSNNTVIGITSIGHCLLLSYFTRVTSFLDWIEANSDLRVS